MELKFNRALFRLLFFLAITIYTDSVFAQDGNFGTKKFILSTGLSYQGQFFGELSLMRAKSAYGSGVIALKGYKLGVESNFNGNNFIYAPKFSYEYSILNITLKAGTTAYIHKQHVDIRLLPEISITSLVIVNLTYGYGVPLFSSENSEVSRHKIALVFNLDKKLWKNIK